MINIMWAQHVQFASSSMRKEHLVKNTSCAMAGSSDDEQMVPRADSNPRKRPASKAEKTNWEPTRKQKRRSVRFDHIEQMEQQKEPGFNNCSFFYFDFLLTCLFYFFLHRAISVCQFLQ